MPITTALLLARLALALIFLVAAVTKLFDRVGGARAMTEFGLPRLLAAPSAILLPLAELAVAVALLVGQAAWWGSVGAALLLALFVAGIAVNLARGRAPDCHCFGQLHSEPVGWQTLIRNLVLIAVAGFVIALGPAHAQRSAIGWIGDLSATMQVALVLGIAGLTLAAAVLWLLLQFVAQNGRLLVRLDTLEQQLASVSLSPSSISSSPTALEMGLGSEATPPAGLPVGAPAPGFNLRGLFGETQTLDALRAAGRPLLLFFTDPNCGPCQTLLPDIARWQREMAPTTTLALVSRGSVEENRAKGSEHGVINVLLQENREVAVAYQSHGTPGAVLILADGRIGSPVAQGAEQIRALVARAVGSPAALPSPVLIPVPVVQAPVANGHGSPCPNCGRIHDNPAGDGAAQAAAPQGLAVGTPAPALHLPDLEGRRVDLADFRGRPTLVLFWNPGCGFCQQMLPDLKAWEQNRPTKAPALLVVSTGAIEENRVLGLASTVVLSENFAGAAFEASGTPSAVLIGADGRIAAPLAVGAPGVMALASGVPVPAPEMDAARPSARRGDPAPSASLPDLDGRTRTLAEFRGSPTLILFWNPGCGFCQGMLDDLKRWEADPTADTPRLLVVSTGTTDANRAMGLRAPVLLDEGFVAGGAFGATGTPSAVLVDTEGRIASDVGVGAPAVLALVRGVPFTA